MKGVLSLFVFVLSSCASPVKFTIDTGSAPVEVISDRITHRGDPAYFDTALGPGPKSSDTFQEMKGRWRDPHFKKYQNDSANEHSWSVTVHPSIPASGADEGGGWTDPKNAPGYADGIRNGILSATDGYSAHLAAGIDASPRIIPRFQRKHYPWGTATTFLAQYGQDISEYAPCNGCLYYEVHGLTPSGQYVKAMFSVTHPKLVSWATPQLKSYSGLPSDPQSDIRRDPGYRLVETCNSSEFEPSLDAIDRFLSMLKIEPK